MIQPYLFFEGTCEDAVNFYRNALGAEVELLMRYSDSPEPPPPGMIPEGSEHKIMHVSFRIKDAVVMASDGGCAGAAKFAGFSLSLSVDNAEEADRFFNALADGGEIQMPLGKTFWAERFGMVKDRFGVAWMISLDAPDAS